ncbi:hypothetical protein LOZ66_005844 [Ophidiomyces ophidiicola]|nr:hypothetical protein LOZ66_005844 [Ophidiomyces ophidiicola]
MPPPQRRGPWVPEEDHELLQLVHSQGPNNWVRISQHMKFRSPKQCRERFHQNLKPSLNHDPISPEEGLLIERMVADMGKRWAEIARRLGNRSDNAVKNWWNGSMNRKKRRAVPRDHPYHAHSHSHSHAHSPGYHHHHHHRAASASASPACAPAWLPAARRPSSSRYPRDDAWADRPRSPRTASTSTSASSTTARHLPPLFTLDFSSHIDLPLTSPCYSEVSNRTPSMVSDHASVASASSPRTLTSPALPADALHHHHHSHSHYSQQQQQHYDARRRGSAPAVGMTPVGKSLAAYATSRPALHHHQSVGSMGSLCRLPSSGPDARDARMGLNNLLN